MRIRFRLSIDLGRDREPSTPEHGDRLSEAYSQAERQEQPRLVGFTREDDRGPWEDRRRP